MKKCVVSLTICLCLAAGCPRDDADIGDAGDVDAGGNEGEGEGENIGGENYTVHPRRESRWQHEVDGVIVNDLLGTGPHQPIGAGLVDGVATIVSMLVVDEVLTGSLQLLQDPLGAATTIEFTGVIPVTEVVLTRAVFADADGDDDTDIVLAILGSPLRVLENTGDGFTVVVGNGSTNALGFLVIDIDDDNSPEILTSEKILRLRGGRLTSTLIATVFEDSLGYCLHGFAADRREPQTVFAVGAVCVGDDVEDFDREDKVFTLDQTLTPTASLPVGMDRTRILTRGGTGEVVVVGAAQRATRSLVVRPDFVGSTSYAVEIITTADLDGDGIDSYVADPSPGDVSPSDTHFIERARETLGPFVVDLDGDGRDDLLIANALE